MLTVTPGPLTLARNETWKPSVFRPPARFVKAVPPSNGGSTLLSPPWCSGSSAPNDSTPKEPRLMPPPALGQSPSLKPTLECSLLPPMSSHSSSSGSGSGSGGFLPLSPEVNVYSNMFTQDATDERVYPLEMFLSVRRDAAHTPYGVLSWSLRQYMQIPTLKVPPHLQLSLNEGAERYDGTMRGALGCSLRGGRTRVKPLRLTHHKVMSILSRITPAKYDVLMDEMMLLPLRQVEEAELMEVCKILFEKAVQEPAYSGLYARLAHDVCFLKDGERDVESREQIFSRRFRRMLIKLCEAQFQQSLQLSPDDLVDRTTGTPLSEEDVQMKRSRLKDRLVGNIRFVAELYKIGFVTERVIDDIIRILVKDYNPDEPLAKEEVVFEVFQTLLRTTGAELKEHMPNLLAQSLGIAKTIELSHPKPRVVFLMMDLDDLNRKGGWVPSELVEQHVRHAKTTKNGKSNANSDGSDVARHNEKGSSIVPPLSPASLITPPENRKTARKSIDGGSLATPPCLLNTEYSNKSKNELNSIHPNSNTSNDIGKMHGNGFNLSIIGSSTTHSNNNNSNNNNNNTNTNNTNTNNNNINTTNNNNNTSDVAKLPARSTEKRWRGQHQPYSQLVLTHANNNNNNNDNNNNGSDIRLNSSMDSLQLNSPVHPSCGGSEYGFQCPMEARQHNIDMSNTHTVVSDGLRSPFAASTGNTPLTDATVNMKGVTEQMMALFRNGEEFTAIAMLRDMELKNIVVCLTWWLRLATTRTSSFEDRKNVVPLLSSLLSTCGYSYDAKTIFSTVLEWICFDMEKAEYEKCPRMFDNIAQMILQCHLPCNDSLSHIEVVRNMMQCGLFNLLMRELTISDGSDRMVTVVKSCYPVSLQILNNLHDPDDDRQILRIAAQNRFRLLPYLLSVSSGTNNTMPGTPSMRPRIPSSPSLSLRSSSLGDSLASTGHYDPLVLCLVLPRVTEDPEFVLFRKLRDAATAAAGAEGSSLTPTASVRWHDEAVQMALSALGNKSTVCELIAIMRVVGSLLACSSVTGNDGRTLASIADVDYVVGEILSKRPGILYQGAVAMELIMYHTQTLNDTTESSPNTDTVRLRPLKRMFDQWCTRNVIHRGAVLELLDSLDRVGDVFSLYTAYHSSVSDVAWSVTLHELRGY